MQQINWGIIGCGDVTEIKSGPAFNKAPNSALIGVMRRDAAKAADYALRHNVPKWYSDADLLINDPEINAIYIATPPSSHEAYALAAIDAGKSVYVEKPMALNYKAAKNIVYAAGANKVKLVVAHYRRQQPFFKKIQELIAENAIGKILLARLEYHKPALTNSELLDIRNAWRVDPAISGGGLFYDLAPHQLDLMYYFFGPVQRANGIAANQAGNYVADDLVTGNILFENGIVFNGSWCFNAPSPVDKCRIVGTRGEIEFGFFTGNTIKVSENNNCTSYTFDALEHVQQPMIEKTVQYFLGLSPNPCSGNDGAEVMRLMECFCL
jgi:predicted dehydrogenase